jgi:hypothetical protein
LRIPPDDLSAFVWRGGPFIIFISNFEWKLRSNQSSANLQEQEIFMEITLEIPETVAKSLGYATAVWPRRALEALLVDECSLGHLILICIQ